MSDIAIRVEGLSKKFHIGRRQGKHKTLRETLTDAFVSPIRRAGKLLRGQAAGAAELDETIWALKDISFEVKRGEAVGIIGRNGSGKSTLLKILSRITEPSKGFAEIHGRVGSLLEVGTGFHQELTGRENIYLNGAILGMKRAEIDRNFDEIVAFSEVEKFIDTPVKHYSSGMYLRLAFAVAAHLEPEILLVDEVLAVGDAEFQKKCLDKMQHVAGEGRTVFFVSHNMMAIQSLCTKAILLNEGSVAFEGPQDQAVMKYCAIGEQLHKQQLDLRQDRVGGGSFRFASVQFLNPQNMTPWNVLVSGQPVIIRIDYLCKSSKTIKDVGIGIAIATMTGAQLFGCRSKAVGVKLDIHPGEGYTDCSLPRFPLKAGHYTYALFAEKNNNVLDWVTDAGSFDVEASDYYGSGYLPASHLPGVLVDYTWQQERKQTDRVTPILNGINKSTLKTCHSGQSEES
ncbi:ABC transporter ATP-binding protein [Candidatus Kuenenia sp.]|uniref:ABC transporter ATP-binding protein n=1 Tax=Candidatus Kuenenia sp. TaxID=2499824 RepID=UPI00321FE407